MSAFLRSPDFSGSAPLISNCLLRWDDVELGTKSIDAGDAQTCARIVVARVGGRFWLPLANSARQLPQIGSRTLLSLPKSGPEAARLWRQVGALVDPARLLVNIPGGGAFAALVDAMLTAGCAVMVDANPHDLMALADEVYLGPMDDVGVLGLLAGKTVWRCTAAGTARELAARAIAWITHGTSYTNPFTNEPCGCDVIIDVLEDWRRMLERNRAVTACAGIAFWKRRRIGQLLTNGAAAPAFRRAAAPAIAAAGLGAVGVWSTQVPPGLGQLAAAAGTALVRLDDGFIRSRGLGSDFMPPASLIADRTGNYLDPAAPSDLETLLATTAFDMRLRDRARRLIDQIIQAGISKYAAGGSRISHGGAPGRRVILVPGQVADDLSIRLGGGAVKDNETLLARVRAANPDAYLIYRPHPDVEAGHRPGALPPLVALRHADEIIRTGAITAWFDKVDEVHTITSLAGFEALLRGRKVATYGQPFYSGWGLTHDHAPITRRQRRLSLEELVAGCLILYPNYLDPVTGLLCGPELFITRLGDPLAWRPSLLTRLRRLQGRTRLAWRHTITQIAPAWTA